MEKLKPHYDLVLIKASAAAKTLGITITAQSGANGLGLALDGVMTVVQGMSRSQFYKSMTSDVDHRIWQDVYHVLFKPDGGATTVLYVKFTVDADGAKYMVISFKKK